MNTNDARYYELKWYYETERRNRLGKVYRTLLVPRIVTENTILYSNDGLEQKVINKDILSKLPIWLKERDYSIIMTYYLKQLTMKKTGKIFGISEARVSQIHSRVMKSLRKATEEDRDALDS